MDRKRLIDYLPPFMQQFIEMQEIMKSANISTDVIDCNIKNTCDDAFILDADEIGIARYEKFLNIIPLQSETLEERRQRVLVNWNTDSKFTLKTLKKRLEQQCGEDNYKICEDSDLINYFIHIAIKANDISISTLKNYLELWLPANLQRNYDFDFEHDKKIYFAFISVFKNHLIHHTEEFSIENLPDWYVDNEENMLLDDHGNIIIMEGDEI